MKRRAFALTLGGLLAMGAAATAHAQVVISQIYTTGGQTGATYKNDFVELYNKSNAPVSLVGWSIQFASASGTFGFSQLAANLNSTIPANGYYLVQFASTTNPGDGVQLPTPDTVSTVNLLGASGKLALVKVPFGLIAQVGCPLAGSGVVDFVGYGAAGSLPCFEGSGPTGTVLSNTATAAFRKDGGCQDTNDNANDFVVAAPAPRNSSITRAPCPSSPADIAVQGFATPARAYIGTDNVTFAVDVTNLGGAPAANTVLRLPIPPGFTFQSSTPAGTVASNILSVNLGSLAPFTGSTVSLVVTPTTEQVWDATFSATTTSPESSTANNQEVLQVTALTTPALCPLKISQIYPGGQSSLPGAFYNQDYVEIKNTGSVPVVLNGRSIQLRTIQNGSWTKFNLPNITLPPGGFYLLGAASPGTTGDPLPVTLDGQTSNVVTLSESTGAIVIVNTPNFLQASCFIEEPGIIDLVGWGDSNVFFCAESFAPVPWIPGNVLQAMFRTGQGCTDTGNNANDFILATPMPRNMLSPVVLCGGGCNPADIAGSGATYSNGTVDIGADNQLGIDDFIVFLTAFSDATGCPGSTPCNPADIAGSGATYSNGTVDVGPDGDLGIDDFIVFLAAFSDSTGCN